MTKTEQIMKAVERLGFVPELDEAGDVKFNFQMKTIYVLVGIEEEQYICMLLPQFREIEEGEDLPFMVACNKMTRDLKVVKVFVDHTFKYVTASYEFYYSDEGALAIGMRNALEVMGVVRTIFRKELESLQES